MNGWVPIQVLFTLTKRTLLSNIIFASVLYTPWSVQTQYAGAVICIRRLLAPLLRVPPRMHMHLDKTHKSRTRITESG